MKAAGRAFLPVALLGLYLAALRAQATPPLVIQHVAIIDANGGPIVPNATVTIRAGRIARIETGAEPVEGAVVVNATGKFLIPGLVDMHVHLFNLEQSFATLRAYGITGVREMYSGVAPRAYSPFRTLPGAPRLVVPGMIDGPARPPSDGAILVTDAEQARLAVSLLTAAGAEFIKVYSSLSRDAYFAIADEARRIGIPFAGHVPESVSPAEAAEAGQLSQEHLINILLASSTREEELRAERIALLADPRLSAGERARQFGFPQEEGLLDTYDPQKAAALFETFVDYGVWQTPTLVVLKRYAEAGPEVLKTPYMEDLPAEKVPEFRSHVARLLKRYEGLVGEMHRAGVHFLAGTDTSPATGIPLGESLHEELELFVASGFTPLEALQTATRNPALYFGLLGLMGTIDEGKAADLVILDANPLEDIRNTRTVSGVVVRGSYFAQAAMAR